VVIADSDSSLLGSFQLAVFLSMGATSPTTRPAHPFFEFGTHSLDPVTSCFPFFGIFNPANPLITRERRNILPV
jgi:hypothetical protein